jgi:hypothetical protein
VLDISLPGCWETILGTGSRMKMKMNSCSNIVCKYWYRNLVLER